MDKKEEIIAEERYSEYDTLNERITETTIEKRVLHIREDGTWEWV